MARLTKSIFLMFFGAALWLINAVSLPIHQAFETADFTVNFSEFGVRSAFAGGNVECVSLPKLESREQEDAHLEDHDADDEYEHADDEHHKARAAHRIGDYVSELAHESKAVEHEIKAAEHETKATEHEAKAVEIHSVTGNCSVLVVSGGALVRNVNGTPKTENGLWILSPPYQSIANILARRGGAGVLFDSVVAGGGTLASGGSISIINPMPDSRMLSYREIRGQ